MGSQCTKFNFCKTITFPNNAELCSYFILVTLNIIHRDASFSSFTLDNKHYEGFYDIAERLFYGY